MTDLAEGNPLQCLTHGSHIIILIAVLRKLQETGMEDLEDICERQRNIIGKRLRKNLIYNKINNSKS